MDQLIKEITQRTGISEDQARQAVDTVVGYLKQQLPAPLAGQIDNFLNGGAADGVIGQVLGGLSGFGKK